MTQARQILLVSGDASDEFTHRALDERGFAVVRAADGERAYQRLLESRFDVLVVGLKEPTESADLIKRVRETEGTRRLPVLVIGEWGSGQPTLALSQGADAYEPTPVHAERLVTSIERLLTEQAIAASGNE